VDKEGRELFALAGFRLQESKKASVEGHGGFLP
jgi:hypothetical protein